MASLDSKKVRIDLSLEEKVTELERMKTNAEKLMSMGTPNAKLKYVVSSLQYAIDVGHGKNAQMPQEMREDVVKSAKNLTNSAMSFHSQFNKFAAIREKASKDVSEDQQEKSDQSTNYSK
ncbi:MAG: hypothetical protein P1U74_05300 [Legionellaceae bacterium]|nr:hypothetical protein [Legionellaceae bacterium]